MPITGNKVKILPFKLHEKNRLLASFLYYYNGKHPFTSALICKCFHLVIEFWLEGGCDRIIYVAELMEMRCGFYKPEE